MVAMATSLDISENKVQIHYQLADNESKVLSYGEKIAKIGPVYLEIFDYIRQFLAVSYQTYANKSVISGVTRQKFTRFLDDVAPSFLLLTCTARP